ncbi:3-hydroxyacyl-CoA dehydrogenase family protein [Actinoplanes sp. LDG1-06]|uniref:3-hydroxyacyl-CoA dehydrogenase family protein n=1 Tax=Paractinoplanes ovalisporus TaxID=2810368 RepID=A0ABS2AKQ1_9ACTN|nr:3-hydroxyacyl-CoA dehydrogenase family protein [Actinoplanes ovalisporus]MBM2620371.1 3-hydroxyacyl-CoA dehydrogenase family protein [Actinoplanes ovalisporus]
MNGYSVGVVGAGVMGASLAQALVGRGFDTVLLDTDPAALRSAADAVAAADRLTRLRRGAPQTPPGQLTYASSTAALAGCRIVVENITEDPAAKEKVHRELDAVLAADTVVAVNTSAVPISGLALATEHPERVLGSHFMNPVALSEMVEVIRSPYTADWALDRMHDLIGALDKSAVVVGDVAGFVINRCLMMFVNEAAALLDDDVATPQQVDRLFRGCLGHRTGPLRTADVIGVDTIVRTLDVLAEHHGPDRFTPSARLRRMVADGHLGRKSGQGFYRYSDEEPA